MRIWIYNIVLIIVFSSCAGKFSIQKRRYQGGFYFSHNGGNKKSQHSQEARNPGKSISGENELVTVLKEEPGTEALLKEPAKKREDEIVIPGLYTKYSVTEAETRLPVNLESHKRAGQATNVIKHKKLKAVKHRDVLDLYFKIQLIGALIGVSVLLYIIFTTVPLTTIITIGVPIILIALFLYWLTTLL